MPLKISNTMKKFLIYSVATLFSLTYFSCSGPDKAVKEAQVLPGGFVRGGVFRINEVQDFRNLFPLSVIEVTSHRIANQVYEGLVKFDQKTLNIKPAIARSWDINDDATQFTFHLRKGVKFQDDECFSGGDGREVTAEDVKYCFTKACTASPDNLLLWLLKDKIEGGAEYAQSTVEGNPLPEGVKGFKVIDDSTFQVNLAYPFAGFLNLVAHAACWIYPKEAYEKYGVEMRAKAVGTGPFQIKNIREGQACILQRNKNYWKKDKHGNPLPYLDAIKFSFLKEKKSELFEFRNGNLDMVYQLPLEMISEVVGDLENAKQGGNIPFNMQVTPSISIQYYGFQHQSEIFKNKDVRLAFNHAIDRESIVTYTLQGEGTPAKYGIVPPAIKDYEFDSIKGYTYDPELARKYLEKAGYANGKGFPKIPLQLNSGGSTNVQVAEVIQKMLKENLNIDIELNIMPWAQHLENAETGKADFMRLGWIADYPDPENFLNILYGAHVPAEIGEKSAVNYVRYQSSTYDKLFQEALRTVDKKERYRLYRKAEQIALNDGAVIPLYYEESTRLLQTHVKNFPANAMEYRDFSEVYIEK